MENAYGRELTQAGFESEYNKLHSAYYGKGDFPHFIYTLAGGMVDTGTHGNVLSTFSKYGKTLLNSHDERKKYIGWLYYVTFHRPFGKPRFENDDYIADLDADNLVKRLEENSNLFITD